MKGRFTTIDLQTIIKEVSPRLIGMRAANIYDIDKKTYLIKLAKPPNHAMLLIESGIRVHTTEYEWAKNEPPSAFAMKCRKHIRTRRLNGISQIGTDRIVCFTFGANETAHHLIVELYDKGNIVLCDQNYVILSLLRPRADDADVRFAVHERYPIELAKTATVVDRTAISARFTNAKPGDPLRKLLNPILPCGPSVIQHALLSQGFATDAKVNEGFTLEHDFDRVVAAVELAQTILDARPAEGACGYIILKDARGAQKLPRTGSNSTQKAIDDEPKTSETTSAPPTDSDKAVESTKQTSPVNTADAVGNETGAAANANTAPSEPKDDSKQTQFFDEFQPFRLKQHTEALVQEYPSFDRAVDVFFSEMEVQKISMKTIAKENSVLKKLDNVRRDHERRIQTLQEVQELNTKRAELIELNIPIVDKAIQVVNSALASSMEWAAIEDMVAEATARGDPVASAIAGMKLESNRISMKLKSPYAHLDASSTDSSDDDESEDEEPQPSKKKGKQKQNAKNKKRKDGMTIVDIDLAHSAFANARMHYDTKKSSATKEKKTIEASAQALKNAEKKTNKALKQVEVSATMQRARKTYWFEKFLWFVSSENFLVVGGRDRQQNEQIVRRYLDKGDIYVHADFHGATSCVIKNPTGGEIPPKTLSEAGSMATCFSSAWDAKIVTGAYWVHHDQVSKSAPTGEYLTAGAFMIRGKKNFLPTSALQVGFGLLWKVDESSIVNHIGERAVKTDVDDDNDDNDNDNDDDDDIDSKRSTVSADPVSADGDGASPAENADAQKEKTSTPEGKQPGNVTAPIASTEHGGDDSNREGKADASPVDTDTLEGKDSANPRTVGAVQTTGDDSDENDEFAFPDTSIAIKVVDGALRLAPEGIADSAARDTPPAPHTSSDASSTPGGKPRSAKEKRDMRKQKKRLQQTAGGDGDSAHGPLPATPPGGAPAGVRGNGGRGNGGRGNGGRGRGTGSSGRGGGRDGNVTVGSGGGGGGASKRGRKGKMNKMKTKYADQDEEDRALAMSVLASEKAEDAKVLSRKEKQKVKREQRKESGQIGSRQIKAVGKQGLDLPEEALAKIADGMVTTPFAEHEDWDDERVAQAQQDKHNTMADLARQEEEEEIQRILEAENIKVLDEDERKAITFLDALTGRPLPDDNLDFCIPVCAPLSALNSYKFRVKMIPGPEKKGRAANRALAIFLSSRKTTAREKELMKCIKENDLAKNLPGKVKVSSGKI